MTTTDRDPTLNRLLAGLKPDAQRALFPQMKLVDLPVGTVLSEVQQSIDYVYFPLQCIVSLLNVMENGSSAEIAVIGSEGLVGIAVFMGGDSTPSRAVVQSAGPALRLPAAALRKAFNSDPHMRDVLLRFTQTLIVQMAQTAVCNRHHTIDQQLCRWLLLSLDRLPGNTLIMTQELIANMLGVRREGVTEAAGKLQRKGAIEYQRGKITILDRSMLEDLCCECYSVVQREMDRLNGSQTHR